MRARIPPYPALSRYLPKIENGKLGHYRISLSLDPLPCTMRFGEPPWTLTRALPTWKQRFVASPLPEMPSLNFETAHRRIGNAPAIARGPRLRAQGNPER